MDTPIFFEASLLLIKVLLFLDADKKIGFTVSFGMMLILDQADLACQ